MDVAGVASGPSLSSLSACVLLACCAAPDGLAADCPGHPDALGTSRTLVVDPTRASADRLHAISRDAAARRPRGGADLRRRPAAEIQQPDSGHSRRAMRQGDLLHGRPSGQCQSGRRPQGARRRPHRWHPQPEPPARPCTSCRSRRAKQEIDDGIASVHGSARRRHRASRRSSASPVCSAPTRSRNMPKPQGIQIWSADFPADDWRHVSPSRVYDLAIQRLEAKGKGILLLHDIQPRTVAALPRILQRAEGPRLSHRSRGAGDAGAAGDADRAAAMAVASAIPRRWRFRAGRKFRTLSLPSAACCLRRGYPISIGRTASSCTACDARAAFLCPRRRCGRGHRFPCKRAP